MKRVLVVLSVLFVLSGLIARQVSATPQGSFVLEGGINRTEGFVPFVAGTTVQTSTSNPYDVVATVYRSDTSLSTVRVEIAGGQSSWTPWVSSGIGVPVFESGVWIFQMQFPESGKVEVGLHASKPSVTDHISVTAIDGTISEIRCADVAPIGKPPTATPTNTATRTPTATGVPPTATPTATSTGVPPTETPTPTSTPSGSPYFTLEGGVNRVEGFVPFASGVLTTTTAHPYDLVLTSYMVGGTSLTIGLTVSGEPDWTCTLAYGAGSCGYSAEKHAWTAEMVHNWWAENKVEFVFRIPEPRRSTDIAIRAVEYAHGTSLSLSARVLPGRKWIYLPFVVR